MTTKQRMGLAAVAGVLAALGHAPFGLWPAALLGFGTLIWLVAHAPRPGWTAWAGGTGYFALALHWIVEPFLVDIARHGWMAPFAVFFLATGLALFWGAAGLLSGRLGSHRAIGFAVALSFAEMARGYVLTGFPWALPAYIWADTPIRMTVAIWGPYGLTLLTLVLLALPMMRRNPIQIAALAVVAGVGFLGLMSLGILREGRDYGTSQPIVRLVQPNAPQHEKWDPDKAHIFVERQIAYTAAEKPRAPQLIVWPESAVPYRLGSAPGVLKRITEAAEGAEVVLGINRTKDGLHHNALITLQGGSNAPGQIYDKVHLVPFGEYIPFGQMARLIGLRSFAARDGYGFSPGDGVRLIETDLGRALPMICYEAIFPQHVRRADGRADYILQITNDAWFGTFSGPFQHLDQARFRAAEQGLPLIRVANTGISAMITARGEVTASIGLGQMGYVDTALPAALPPTPYARIGDLPIAGILLVTLTALFYGNMRNTLANSRRST